jgi:hypothetical protein
MIPFLIENSFECGGNSNTDFVCYRTLEGKKGVSSRATITRYKRKNRE